MTGRTRRSVARAAILPGIAGLFCGEVLLRAQIQMPDAREMSGIPRPVNDLPPGTVSVRLIRGDLSQNLANHSVQLEVNGRARTEQTDENGRAEFSGFPNGATLRAVAVVEGERLESQQFPAPAQGAIRLMLVATDKQKAAAGAGPAKPPAPTGDVVIGSESRIVIEPDDAVLRVFYMLDIRNNAQVPVNPPVPFTFDPPTGSLSATVMEDSSKSASVLDNRVRIEGPFAPGSTFVQIGFIMPAPDGTAELTQTFPVTLEHLAVIVQKVGDARLSSPQVARQQEMPANGQMFIVAAGNGSFPAGQAIVLRIAGLPHHSALPRWIAVALAAALVVAGVVAARRPPGSPGADSERTKLIARREKLLQDLVRLEKDHRAGRGEPARYAARREELMKALEVVYGALDVDDQGPQPADRTGLAA